MHWPLALSPLQHGLFVLVGLLAYVVVTRLGGYHRHPSAAIAWVLMIGLLPYLGLPLFLVFGTRKLVRPARRASGGARPGRSDAQQAPGWALQLLAALDAPAPVRVATITFHERGEQSLSALLALIGQAREYVDVCTYLLADDEVGAAVLDALAACTRRGVRTRLLIDAIGGWRSVRSTVLRLHGSGVRLRWFMPVLRNPVRGRANLRDHRKIVVVDGQAFWSGGRNFAASYFHDGDDGWVDLCFIVHGPVALQARALLEHDWRAARGDVAGATIPAVTDAPGGAAPLSAGASGRDAPSAASGPVQLIPSGPDLADDTLHALLIAAAWRAESHIVAVTPYFVPEDALLDAWCVASRRGVRIDLIVPQRSNHRLADLARGRALRALAGAGGRVFLHPRMVHAKLVVVDDQIALCGSANLDARSLLLNFELMTAFYGAREIGWLTDWAGRQRDQSARYAPVRPSWPRDVLEGVVRAVGFQL